MEIERLRDLNQKDVSQGSCVIYWMQHSKRVADNPALAYAVEQANSMQLPLVILIVIDDAYPEANLATYYFALEGIAQTALELEAMNATCFIVLGNMVETVSHWATSAALLVTDKGYLRFQRSWRSLVAIKSPCRVVEVEGDVLFPVELVTDHEAYNAKVLRDRIHRLLPGFELKPCSPEIVKTSLPESVKEDFVRLAERSGDYIIDNAALAANQSEQVGVFLKRQNGRINPANIYKSGYKEACAHLKHFTQELLSGYYKNRGNPATDFQSNLSPYLHFGQISLRQALQAVISSLDMPESEFFKTVVSVKPGLHPDDKVNGALEFFEEAVVRRELSMNFCHFNDDYDQYSALPAWARQTLREHVSDPRPYLYELPALENAETHDPYWNAAQKEMLLTGKMHGYMRMYWGKKLIEWCREPEEAFQIALHLNNKYELDGRDPNGFAGVAWCFGKHDRAWGTFPAFGNVRIMKESGLNRKFDMQQYIARIDRL